MPKPTTAAGARACGLRAHLVALILAALLPAFAVGAIAVAAAVHSYRHAFEDRLAGTAAALASAVGSEVDTFTTALSVLATSGGLDPDGEAGVAGFQDRARQAAEILGTRIHVLAPDLSLVLHTGFPAGVDPAATRTWEALDLPRRAFETGRPAVGDLLTSRVNGRPVALIYVPVTRGGEVVHVLGAAMESARLSRVLGAGHPDDGYASVVDGRARVLARSFDKGGSIGQQVRDWLRDGIRAAPSGVLQGVNLLGVPITTAFHRVPGVPGWTVTVAQPDSAYYASLWQPLAALALGGVGTLGLSLLVAVRIGKRILGPVDWLTRKAERVAASGGTVEVMPTGPPVRVREFERLRAAVVQAHVALQERASAVAAGEARRALLMREVDHRAKNALAVVQSVLRLTPRDEPEAFAAAVEARVAALARVHSLLAEGGWSGADLRAVAERELAPYAPPRRGEGPVRGPLVSLDGPEVPLATAAVQPLAMVLHELATNAAKHGSLSVPGGRVEVRWRAGGGAGEDGMLRLRWAETGGPPVAGAPSRRGFGTRVVEATVRGQLGGAVERRWEPPGLVVEVAVPLARLVADAGDPAPGRRDPGQPSTGPAVDAAAADAPAGPLDRPLTLAVGERKGGGERERRRPGEVVHLWSSRREGGRADACPAPPGDDRRAR